MKRIIIVGGTSGIGAALVTILEKEGHNVVTMSRTQGGHQHDHEHPVEEEEEHKTQATEKPKSGGWKQKLPLDLSDTKELQATETPETTTMAETPKSSWKQRLDVTVEQPNFLSFNQPLDGLVYCPGTINLKPFSSLKLSDFQNDLEVNFLGLVKTLQMYYPLLQKSENASVVLFSTVAVQTGMAFHSSVAAAKGAIEGMSRALAAEWAPKIRVNTIAPSLTETPLAERLLKTDKQRAASIERHPMKRIGKAEDIAEMAAFLLSDKSSWITGQIIQVDGGLSAIKNL